MLKHFIQVRAFMIYGRYYPHRLIVIWPVKLLTSIPFVISVFIIIINCICKLKFALNLDFHFVSKISLNINYTWENKKPLLYSAESYHKGTFNKPFNRSIHHPTTLRRPYLHINFCLFWTCFRSEPGLVLPCGLPSSLLPLLFVSLSLNMAGV